MQASPVSELSTLIAAGRAALAEGRLDEARRQIAAAIAGDPAQAVYHDDHGLVLAALGRADAAEAAHRHALALDPQLAAAHHHLAALLRVGGRAPEALAAVDAALACDAHRPAFHLARGEVLVSLERPREAAESSTAAINLKPDYADAFFALGELYQRSGDHDGARLALGWYLALDSADRRGAQAVLSLIDPATTPDGLPPAYIRTLFDSCAGRFEAHLVGKLRYRAPEALRDAVARASPGRAAGDVLDLGCGTGLVGAAFKPLARRLVGVDLSPAMIEQSRARAIYDELLLADVVAALRQMPAAFDLIVAADMFIYLGDLAPVLGAIHGSLRPGGLVAFSLETASGRPYRLTPTRRFAHDPTHVAGLAREAGFAAVLEEPIILRTEADAPVAGAAVVLRKPAA
jgi:predicted TPR repeat methyltransferase